MIPSIGEKRYAIPIPSIHEKRSDGGATVRGAVIPSIHEKRSDGGATVRGAAMLRPCIADGQVHTRTGNAFCQWR